jgi:hypothetical protein
VSFVILTAYAPPQEPASGDAGAAGLPLLFVVAQVPASGSAGPASFPLLFNLATPIIPDPDPEPEPNPEVDPLDWRDHSPDLLLAISDADADGLIFEEPGTEEGEEEPEEAEELVLATHSPATLVFAETSLAALSFTDHTPD